MVLYNVHFNVAELSYNDFSKIFIKVWSRPYNYFVIDKSKNRFDCGKLRIIGIGEFHSLIIFIGLCPCFTMVKYKYKCKCKYKSKSKYRSEYKSKYRSKYKYKSMTNTNVK